MKNLPERLLYSNSWRHELTEVPAHDLLGDEPEPGVAPVVDGFLTAEVLAREQALGLGQFRVGSAGAGDIADHDGPAEEFRPSQLCVVVAGV